MSRAEGKRSLPPVLAALVGAASLALAAMVPAATLSIGYLELNNDPRYYEEHLKGHYQAQPWGRPYAGAEVALDESRFAGAAAGVDMRLQRASAEDEKALLSRLEAMRKGGTHFFLVDAPGAVIAALGKATAGEHVLVFNISALDDRLRREDCRRDVLHVVPSRAMLADALAQDLVAHKWREVLALVGPKPQDEAMYAAFKASAKRYGLDVVDAKRFVLGRNPRERSENNIALLTSGQDYDVVFVADSDGEFARAVPYQTQRPRVVAGAAGLVADWWHWASERYGAPQLNNRFVEKAARPMTGYDWAAWMAVKAIAEAVLRTGSGDFATLRDYIEGDQLILDGFKGNRLSFRSWNHQLRQPIMLTSPNYVIAIAPLEGFLHRTNNLDTLGQDQRESQCSFK